MLYPVTNRDRIIAALGEPRGSEAVYATLEGRRDQLSPVQSAAQSRALALGDVIDLILPIVEVWPSPETYATRHELTRLILKIVAMKGRSEPPGPGPFDLRDLTDNHTAKAP